MSSATPRPPGPALVLASASARRVSLLAGLGVEPLVRPVDLDESRLDGEAPERCVERLARAKASARTAPGELILAADTLVVLDDEVLGKPSGPAEARSMLARLAGREHLVVTGVAVCDGAPERMASAVEATRVTLAELPPDRVAWYVGTGEPLDKAGAYAIQGLGALFVERIEGNYSNVVGLPLPLTRRLFRALGYDLLDFRSGGSERPTEPPQRGSATESTPGSSSP